MDTLDRWNSFCKTGSVRDYLEYKRGEAEALRAGGVYENCDRCAGDMGAQDRGNGQGDNSADA